MVQTFHLVLRKSTADSAITGWRDYKLPRLLEVYMIDLSIEAAAKYRGNVTGKKQLSMLVTATVQLLGYHFSVPQPR